MGERGWSPFGPRQSRDGLEWQLTPTGSPLLARLLYLSWTLSVGFLGMLVTTLCVLVAVAAGLPLSVSVVVSAIATIAGGGLVLSRLASSRHGLIFLRLRAPEPSDPTRSVVEHARVRTLVALAAVGALVHATLIVAVSALEVTSLAYLLPVGGTYAGSVLVRWWLPTAGVLDRQRGRLRLASFPHGTEARSRWHGALETAIDINVDDLEGFYRFETADTVIAVLSVADTRFPVVAAVPVAVADRLEGLSG